MVKMTRGKTDGSTKFPSKGWRGEYSKSSSNPAQLSGGPVPGPGGRG